MKQVRLRNRRPIRRGATRAVFAHPRDPDLLIKVMRPEFLAARRAATRGVHRLKPGRMLSIFIREIREQLILLAKGEDIDPFLQRVIGYVDTDLGLGQVVEAVKLGGSYGPSLAQLVRRGRFDAAARDDLERFCAAVIASDLVVSKLIPGNVVHGADSGGAPRFVLVDAYGEGALFPWKGMFPALHRRRKRRAAAELWEQVARLEKVKG